MINNSAADCSILLKFGVVFDQVSSDLEQTFKVKKSKAKVTYSVTLRRRKIAIKQFYQ